MKAEFQAYNPLSFDEGEMQKRAKCFLSLMKARRSIREFSRKPVPRQLIEQAILTAATAPSGANRQPWRFVVVSDISLKRKIRLAAEAEEKVSYEERMPQEWLDALGPLGTSWEKPFLEKAPWLVVVFAESYGLSENGSKRKNYYVSESVGIACGLFITAIHHMGLVTLTHTPSPMGFLSELLGRPRNERPYILFPVGFPAEGATVPQIKKKPLDQVALWMDSGD